MEFIDHTGHKFSLESYSKYPLGYDTTTLPFTFWLSSYNNGRKLSVKNWYCLPIWILLDTKESIESIEIHSSTFWVLSYNMMKKLGGIEAGTIISTDFKFNESDIIKYGMHDSVYDSNYFNDFFIECGQQKLVPLYVFGLNEEEGTYTTNILIKSTNSYTPIAVSGEFHDECEELVVNGQNLGFNIPKDVLNAMYETSYFDRVPDEVLFNRKMKELVLNYMNIRGENGNYNSAISSLKWFGYGDKVEFTKLIKTDNQLLSQYIHDSFDINNDLLHSFRTFTNSTLIALRAKENEETENIDWQKWDNEFWGEGKPFTEDLFMKIVPVTYDEGDINFWKPFYDWNFTEMALKLSLLSSYLKKYFLPTHLLVKSATIDRKVFINDTKHITKGRPFKTERPVCCWDDVTVSFPKDVIYIYNQKFYVDESYNNIRGNEELGTLTNENIIYINDAVASIPIEFSGSNFYDVNMLITRDGNKVFESKFQFASDSEDNKYDSFILYPKTITHPDRWTQYGMSYWLDKTYRMGILCNGKWFYHDFVLKVPELQLGIGTLKYNYFTTYEEESVEGKSFEEWVHDVYDERNSKGEIIKVFDLDNIDKDSVLNQELLEQWNNTNTRLVMKSLFTQIDHISDNEVDFNSFMYVPSLVEVNDIMFYDKLQSALSLEQNSSAMISSYQTYLKYLASKTYIYDLGIQDNKAIFNYGDAIIPLMKFNNGIELGQVSNSFKLKEFYVDVYFDIDTNNTYYAKVTYSLDDLKKYIGVDGVLEARHLKSYGNLLDSILIERKYKVTNMYPIYKGMGINRTIDWDATPLEWRQFYIDEYEATRKQCTIRVVWRGRVEGPSNTYYDFGGYDQNGYPIDGYFLDRRLELEGSGYCTMNCPNKLCQSLCKYRKENNHDIDQYDRNHINNDGAGDSSELEKIANEVTMANLNKLIKDTSFKYKIPNMDNYLNRVHIYDIYYKNGKVFKYDATQYPDNASQVELYRQFFNDDGTQKVIFDNRSFEYDFYLVHDDKQWFGVFISRMTIDNCNNEDDLEGPEKFHYIDDDSNKEYILKKYRSGDRFFINRMMYEDAAPTYKIDKESIIVCTINNVNYPYILNKNPKWSVVPYSLGVDEIDGIECYTNTALLTIPDRYNTNKEGYYDIKVRYSIDANVNHQQIKKRRVLIK